MANTIIPGKSTTLTTRDGNWYQIMEVEHTTGTQTDVEVPLTAGSVAELPESGNGQTKANITVSQGGGAAGKSLVSIASGVASGTYILVVRYIGSGAGFGGSHVG